MSKFSRDKGKRGERMACAYLDSLGFTGAARTAQTRGKTDGETDIKCPALDRIHFEVKMVRGLEVGSCEWEAAVKQARAEAKPGTRWVVLWKPKARPWCLTMGVDDAGYVGTVTGDKAIAWSLREMQSEAASIASA